MPAAPSGTSRFNAPAGRRAGCGEGSNGYTMKEAFPRAFDRLVRYAPAVKLLYAVRDPFARIESFWMELRSQHPDYVHYDFNKAVDINRDWLTDPSNYLVATGAFPAGLRGRVDPCRLL